MTQPDRNLKIRPGYLVNLSTKLEGGVTYTKRDLDHREEGTAELSKWETEKITADKTEHERAVKVRGRIRSLVRSACVWTPFGIICPKDKVGDLDEKIAEARALEAGFNDGHQREDGTWQPGAVHTKVRFNTLRGEIAENAAEAVQAVRSEVVGLLEELEQAMRAGAVQGIRDVAQKATQMGRLLEEGTSSRNALERAVTEARRVGRLLVKQVEDGAASAEEVLKGANVSLIATARMAFTEDEMGEIDEEAMPAMPAVAVQRFDDLDGEYVPEEEPEPAADPAEVAQALADGELVAAVEAAGGDDPAAALQVALQQSADDMQAMAEQAAALGDGAPADDFEEEEI